MVVAHVGGAGVVLDDGDDNDVDVLGRFAGTLQEKAGLGLVGPVGKNAGKSLLGGLLDGGKDVATDLEGQTGALAGGRQSLIRLRALGKKKSA